MNENLTAEQRNRIIAIIRRGAKIEAIEAGLASASRRRTGVRNAGKRKGEADLPVRLRPLGRTLQDHSTTSRTEAAA